MKFSSPEQDAIISLLTRIYQDVVEIEAKFGLIAGDGDLRPRIDYFHDAIRSYTSDQTGGQRLSIEYLAYDLRCLRYIQEMPLSPFKPNGEKLSASQSIMTAGAGLMATNTRPDRATRERLVELYQHYAVMYAALLKPAADSDYNERTDNLNNDVKDIHAIISQLEGKTDVNRLAALVQNMEEPELRMIVSHFLQQGKLKSAADVKKLIGHLKNQVKLKDKQIKTIDTAHMQYATAQLGIFEESKDMLKNLASKGMNLVGKFVQASIQETKRQMGR